MPNTTILLSLPSPSSLSLNTTTLPSPLLLLFSYLPAFLLRLADRLHAIKDWLSLLAIGILAESVRRCVQSLRKKVEYEMYINSSHEVGEDSYDWLLSFWTTHPSWQARARDFYYCTRFRPMSGPLPWQPLPERKGLAPTLSPRDGVPHYIKFQGHSFRFEKVRTPDRGSANAGNLRTISVRVLSRSIKPFDDLILEAKKAYQERNANQLIIKTVNESATDGPQMWKKACHRFKRPWKSVIVEEQIRETLLRDIQEFMQGRMWYTERGVPWRRGYLLHGRPGTGKTSTIHAIASELNLPIHVLTLSSSDMNDSKLLKAMTAAPVGSIIVIEDIDTSTKNRSRSSQLIVANQKKNGKAGEETAAGITLSRLLNAIDGIAGSEGRIVIMTTNHKERLDPALIRPGRVDVKFEYGYATSSMIRELFVLFYPVEGEGGDETETKTQEKRNTTCKWEKEDVKRWTEEWVDVVPTGTFSIAQLQGLLMLYKTDPEAAIKATPAWVARQREIAMEGECVTALTKVKRVLNGPKLNDMMDEREEEMEDRVMTMQVSTAACA